MPNITNKHLRELQIISWKWTKTSENRLEIPCWVKWQARLSQAETTRSSQADGVGWVGLGGDTQWYRKETWMPTTTKHVDVYTGRQAQRRPTVPVTGKSQRWRGWGYHWSGNIGEVTVLTFRVMADGDWLEASQKMAKKLGYHHREWGSHWWRW